MMPEPMHAMRPKRSMRPSRRAMWSGAALTLGGAIAAAAAAGNVEHQDIHLQLPAGGEQLLVGRSNFFEPSAPPDLDERVFLTEFGDNAIDYFTDDPGFNASNGDLPGGVDVGFDVMDALRIWDPVAQDFEQVAPSRLQINFGSSLVVTPASAGAEQEGFLFVRADPEDGDLHRHINFFLLPPDAGGVDREPGVYLLQLRMELDVPGVAPSDVVYVLMLERDPADPQGSLDELFAAEQYVRDVLVTPAGCAEDITGDGTVDLSDLNRLLAAFNQPASADPPADITGDGFIDLGDLNALLPLFNAACP
jgi:hypothetical protein